MYPGKVELCGVDTSQLPVLSEAEKSALIRAARAGDRDARQQMIQGNLRLVLSVVQKFSNRGENLDDLFQVGCIGLIKAIDNLTGAERAVLHLRGTDDRRRDPPLPAGQQRRAGQPFDP